MKTKTTKRILAPVHRDTITQINIRKLHARLAVSESCTSGLEIKKEYSYNLGPNEALAHLTQAQLINFKTATFTNKYTELLAD